MLKNAKITIPFCFCWANETWKGIWHGLDNPDVLIEQKYLGEQDYTKYFNYLLPFFKDDRYIKINNMPMFHIYKLDDIPDLDSFIKLFNDLAISHGFEGVYFVVTHGDSQKVLINHNIYGQVGVDIFNNMRYEQSFVFRSGTLSGKIERKIFEKLKWTLINRLPFVLDYKIAIEKLNIQFKHQKHIPCVFPNWDNSARSGKKAMIFKNASPQLWKIHLNKTLIELKKQANTPKFVVIKSWNEWAEGNYLEPDLKFGHEWLNAIKEVKDECL